MNIAQFSNPVNVLQRAEEHVEVGQKQIALLLLYDTLNFMNNKRTYSKDKEETMRLFHTWSQTHEQMARLFVRLCVDLRDSGMARDGLHAYRTISDKVPRSLESVIKYLFDLADERLNAVLATSRVNNVLDDLEEGSTPEALLLATMTSERERGRAEGANLVSAWLTFSWEVLRNVLDLLKVNPGLETAYHSTAHRALAFCKTHERKNEFKKLCANLKLHFQDMIKFSKEGKLTAESLELHLATRFEQLKAATALHQWTEGFATIGDIHKILDLTQKKPPAQLMATYYSKLTQLFLMSDNLLFHAYSSIAYYDLSREKNKSLKADDFKAMANQVVLAGLSIPLPASSASSAVSSQSLDKERDRRLSMLLGFDANPSRANVIATLAGSRALHECSPQVQELFAALEQATAFDPLGLVPAVASLIQWVRADDKLKCYAAHLDALVVVRLVSALSRVYSKMFLEQLHGLTRLLGLSAVDTERAVLRAVRARQLPLDVRFDHASRTLAFISRAQEDERAKTALASLAVKLAAVAALIAPPVAAATAVAPRPVASLAPVAAERKQLVARRRAQVDAVLQWQQRQRQEREEHARRVRADADAARQQKAHEEQQRREHEEKERVENEIRMKNRLAASGLELPSDMSLEDKERAVRELQEKRLAALREVEKKAAAKLRRLDVFVRACREAERPLLEAQRAAHTLEDRRSFDAHQASTLARAREEHERGLRRKGELAAVMASKAEFERLVMPAWLRSIEAQKQARADARAEMKRRDKLERARLRREEAIRKMKLDEEQQRRQEMEAARIREAEEEIRREELHREEQLRQQDRQHERQQDRQQDRQQEQQQRQPPQHQHQQQPEQQQQAGGKYVPPSARGARGPPRVADTMRGGFDGPPRGRFDARPPATQQQQPPAQQPPAQQPPAQQQEGATAPWRRKGA